MLSKSEADALEELLFESRYREILKPILHFFDASLVLFFFYSFFPKDMCYYVFPLCLAN